MTGKLASFYTPRPVAQVLTDWAITSRNANVLDPSFGGCAFLCAALETLSRLGHPSPGSQIYGVDIDADAQEYLTPLFAAGAEHQQFVESDFFEVSPTQLVGKQLFDAVVGNPPYIRYHDIPKAWRIRAVDTLKKHGITISGRASYWAFFLLYSMQFLKADGRLAMVLPGALLHTDYSAQVRDLLLRHFARVNIFLLEQRIFDDTEEESVLVCGEGARQPHKVLRIGSVSTMDQLQQAVRDSAHTTREIVTPKSDMPWLSALLPPEVHEIFSRVIAGDGVITAGEWVYTRLGVVTGSNDYFILTPAEKDLYQLPDEVLLPIVRRPARLTGLWITDETIKGADGHEKGKHLLLAIPADYAVHGSVQEYLADGEKLGIHKATKCVDRKPWYAVPHTSRPPAFMPVMSASWSRLVINDSSYTCTNNILKVFLKDGRSRTEMLQLALGTLSTISQLSAEIVGRSYGGGVLKLEPKEFAHLSIPLVPNYLVGKLAQEVDGLLREKKNDEATQRVDEALLGSGLGLDKTILRELRGARDFLFLRRRRHRADSRRIVPEAPPNG